MSVILATAGYDHKIRFWEAPSGICSRTLRFSDSQVNCLEITPDKQFLAAAGNPAVRLFEINSANHNPLLACEGHTASVTGLGFHREGRWMYTCSEDNTVKIWDLRSPGFQRSFDCKCPVNSVALHPNQAELISGDQKGNVRVWDLSTSKMVNELVPDNSVPIRAVTVSEDARNVVAVNQNAEVFVWEPVSSSDFREITRFFGHESGYCIKAKISPDCRSLVTTGSDKTARLWDTNTWQLTQTLSQHQQWVWDATFSADSSYLVTASSDHSARLWSLGSGEVVRQYTGHQGAVTAVALNDST
jgi:G protein beta subunit-like protein